MGVLTSDSVIRSADSHVLEPGDLSVERVAEKYRGRAPKIVSEIETKAGRQEGEWVVCDGIGSQRVAIERNFAGLSADLISKAITRNVANLYGI
ncbi:MAG: hypothetical protein O7H39_19890 [Gammaproteobacteria bacterium]|nr:hypothetical protein [Gammaproteobacteria bacterium]